MLLPRKQEQRIEIGLEVAEEAKKDMAAGDDPGKVLLDLMGQCLRRDDGWKDYYEAEMNGMEHSDYDRSALKVFETERRAEQKFQRGSIDEARALMQKLQRTTPLTPLSPPWRAGTSRSAPGSSTPNPETESNRLQVAAHKRNRRLLKPKAGMEVKRVKMVSQKRAENCATRGSIGVTPRRS